MQQFVVEKVNRLGEEVWTSRVLTIDAANHVLYLSQSGDVSNMNHHCMVKIKAVNWWPHYSALLHSTAFLMGKAPLTFCIEGSTLNTGPTSPLARVFHPRTREIRDEERSAVQRSTAVCVGAAEERALPSTVFVRDTWMLRCMTREDIDPLLTALRAAVVHPSCVKGTIHADQSQSGEAPAEQTDAGLADAPVSV